MKKVLFVMLAFAGTMFAANNAGAQTAKIGVFDVDMMVQVMPGYRAVDSLVSLYEQDSLRGDYDFAVREYNRTDSTYKADSAAGKPASVLNYIKDQRTQFATTLIYWQQIAQQRSEGKRQELAAPMYEKVLTAYDKVLKANNYLVVLKPGAYEMGSKVENVFEKVARELKVNLPEQLRSPGAADEPAPAASGATRPATGGARPAQRKQ
ncbi:OmpH family outer membrane protein [Aridibaculum aurantiacum]|uniref:OmpH family outer membrane protein n=1 Tax=Aridibaculum aurantiacum TaxID=2810307 RepID=UPI001A9664F0|nr:OmpH family outer membrane protein [Aridibaculum aurantiacum]